MPSAADVMAGMNTTETGPTSERVEKTPLPPGALESTAGEDKFLKVAEEQIKRADDALAAKLREPEPEPEEDIEVDEVATAQALKEAAEAPENEDEVPVEEAEPAPGMTYEKAFAALRLDKFSSKALAKLSQRDVIELASSRATVRAGVDAMAKENAELRKAVADQKPRESATASPATGAPSFDVKKATTQWREKYGEDDASLVEEGLGAVTSWASEQIHAAKAEMQPLIQTVMNLQLQLVRQELSETIPELKDKAFFTRVRERASKLSPDAYGGDLEAMLSDAAALVKATSNPKVAPKALAARGKAQVQTTSRTQSRAPASKEDRFLQVATAVLEGDTNKARELAAAR